MMMPEHRTYLFQEVEQRFKDIALDIVPIGAKPSVVDLRESIGQALQRAVSDALEAQLEQQIPNKLRQMIEDLEKANKALIESKQKLTIEREEFRKVVQGQVEFLKAVEDWIDWCQGDGDTDEHRARWERVIATVTQFRSLRREIANAR